MAEVSAAASAHHLGAEHAVAYVRLFLDRILACRREEGRPAATGVVLALREEELRAAAGTAVDAGLEDVVVLAGERRLGALPAQDPVVLVRQLPAPLRLALLDLRHGDSFQRSSLCGTPNPPRSG